MAPAQPAPAPLKPLIDPLVSIIMPIYNERRLIDRVLERVFALPFRKQVIMVDDASRDGTYEHLRDNWASRPDAVLDRHEVNAGKGDIVLIQDADLEYSPEELPRLLEPLIRGETRVVFGSRFMGSVRGMRLPNRVANWLLARMVSILYGQRITDEATAYKIFRSDVIVGMKLECRRFEFCPEVTAKVLRSGERIMELPVTFDARTFEEGKKIGWPDFVTAVWVLFKNRF
jgi:dolichol-phosphate mannosyltransferase